MYPAVKVCRIKSCAPLDYPPRMRYNKSMIRTHNPALVENSRKLRREATDEENTLWYRFLRELPVRFWRQKIIGDYIVDFCCPKKRLVIELDGAQHYEDEAQREDRKRDGELNRLGYTVLRYSNHEIHRNFEAVCQDIWSHIGET